MMRQHQNEPPPFELIANRPDALKAIVARCLAKDPQWRYQNASQMLQALQEAQTRRSSVTPPATEPETVVVNRRPSDPPAPLPLDAPAPSEVASPANRPPSQPPPPAPSYAAAPEPAAPRSNRAGVLVAVGAAAVIAIGAVFLLSRGGDDGSKGTFGRAAVATATAVPPTTAPARTPPPGRTPPPEPTRPPAATPSLNVVRTTPTAAQRYPASLEKEFMDDCTGANASQTVCRCMLDILEARYDVNGYREFERAVNRNERRPELEAIAKACV
jgi:serine/threonine protein kinase